MNDLVELGGGAGGLQPLADDDAKRLRGAVSSARFTLQTGKDDRLLRRLTMDAEFGLDVPAQLRATLGRIVGARLVRARDRRPEPCGYGRAAA